MAINKDQVVSMITKALHGAASAGCGQRENSYDLKRRVDVFR